jgi:hypothetical protein
MPVTALQVKIFIAMHSKEIFRTRKIWETQVNKTGIREVAAKLEGSRFSSFLTPFLVRIHEG